MPAKNHAAYVREWRKTPSGQASEQTARAKRQEWQQANPELARRARRRSKFKARYGITLDQYERMFATQAGRCAACGEEAQKLSDGVKVDILHVDHDHDSGAVRSLLCMRCNRTLGLLKDKPELADALARYLREWRA